MAGAGAVLALIALWIVLRPPTTEAGVLLAASAPAPLVLIILVPVLRFARRLPS